MLTLYFYNLRRTLLTAAAFSLAIFSKETALIIIPALILLTKRFHRLPLLLLASLILVYGLLRYSAVPQIWGTPAVNLSFSENIGTRLGLVSRWLLMLITPLKPTLSDVVPILKITDPRSLFSLFLIVIAFLKIKNKKLLVLFLIMLAPGLNIIPVPRVGSPHYAYLPLIPFALGLVLATHRVGRPLLYLWLAIASVSTFLAGFHYKNDLTLFTPEVKADPDFSEGHSYLGNYHLAKGNYPQAETELELAIKTRPRKLYFYLGYPDMINLAGVKFTLNKLEESRNLYQKAKETASPNLLPYINSALLLLYPSPEPQ
jgi:tetratricopeptide (TPR) repeat protein